MHPGWEESIDGLLFILPRCWERMAFSRYFQLSFEFSLIVGVFNYNGMPLIEYSIDPFAVFVQATTSVDRTTHGGFFRRENRTMMNCCGSV